MSKMNENLRREILENVIKDTFGETEAKMQKQEEELAILARNYGLGHYKEMWLQLPKHLVAGNDAVQTVNVGYRTYLSINQNEKTSWKCLALDQEVTIPPDTTLAIQINRFCHAKNEFDKEKRTLRNHIRSLLNSANTIKQLLEMWPEAEQYMPADTRKATGLPISVDEINQRIQRNKHRSTV